MAYFGFKDLSSLSDVDLTIYRYVTAHQSQVVYMRVRDIADNAHVSNSSVMRFIHKIGFSSFPAFKAYLKNSQTLEDAPNKTFTFINKSNFPGNIENKITLVADRLYECDNIITLGMGSSGYIAGYMARKMASLGFNTSTISDPTFPLESKLRYTTNNAIICLSVSGETSELIEELNKFVNNDDTFIVSITGNLTSTIARMSDYALGYQEPEERIDKFYDLSSQIPATYLVEAVISCMKKKAD